MRRNLEAIYALVTARWLLALSRGARRPVFVVRDGGLGDIIATFPVVRALKAREPDRPIWYLCNRAFVEVPGLSGAVARTVAVRCNDAVGKRLSRHAEVYLPRYGDEFREEVRVQPESLAGEMMRRLEFTKAEFSEPRMSVPVPTTAGAAWMEANLPAGRPYIAVHTGPTSAVRQWPREHWEALVAWIQERRPELVVAQIGANVYFRKGVARQEPLAGALDMRGAPSITDTLALIGRSAAFVGVDSGYVHGAAAMGVPGVALFGPTDPRRRLPAGGSIEGLVAQGVECLGCHHLTPRLHWEQGCPHEIRCMRELGVEEVGGAILARMR